MIDCGLGEKPPADSVVSAWHAASNSGIPAACSTISSAAVRPAYSRQRYAAVSRTCGASDWAVGPGASVKNSWRTPNASRGSIATNSVMTPIPPSHWVSARQNIVARSSCPKSTSTVAPVVVKPDIDSNTASTMLSSAQTTGWPRTARPARETRRRAGAGSDRRRVSRRRCACCQRLLVRERFRGPPGKTRRGRPPRRRRCNR